MTEKKPVALGLILDKCEFKEIFLVEGKPGHTEKHLEQEQE